MTDKQAQIANADIQWLESGAPYSLQFEDIYFSREGGLEETHHVFLQANDLLRRWQEADKTGLSLFVIAELGFGTGLNFLCCWQLWEQAALQNLRLHFISCEKYPIKLDALQQALAGWPQLQNFSSSLIEVYPDHSPGYHRLHLSSQNGKSSVTLDLYYGDAQEMLSQQLIDYRKKYQRKQIAKRRWKIDAWFLDGFAPRVNPDMWNSSLLQTISTLSGLGTTLSSYSVAGHVLRGLAEQGFKVEKRSGFGNKRQMLYAEFAGTGTGTGTESATAVVTPGQKTVLTPDTPKPDVIVIGAGLAGCSTAWQLARRGYRVTVLEQEAGIAQQASGNPQAVLQCRLNRSASPEWHFNLQSYLYASRLYTSLAKSGGIEWHNCGVLTLDSAYGNTRSRPNNKRYDNNNYDNKDYTHFASAVLRRVNAFESSTLSGIEIAEDGFFLPHGGWLNPVALCQMYLQHPLISVQLHTRVESLKYEESAWQVYAANERRSTSAETVIIANSYCAAKLEQSAAYPVLPLRGQVSYLQATPKSARLACVVCAQSYIVPVNENMHSIGASYVRNSVDTTLSTQEHRQNIEGICVKVSGLDLEARGLDPQSSDLDLEKSANLSGRASIRGSTLDHMPILGQLPDPNIWHGIYGGAQHLSAQSEVLGNEFFPGLYLNVGHGSHGLTTTPLAAEYIASQIAGEPSPLQKTVTAFIEPQRFLRRANREKFRDLTACQNNSD